MLRKLAILVAVVAVQYAFAADDPKPKPGLIQGTVADAINGQPLANASITLSPVRNTNESNVPMAATSDPNGQFELEEVPPGEYTLIARKPGFIDRLYGARVRSNHGIPIAIRAGEVVKGIAVNMLRGAVIAGTVVNDDGEPFANVSVRALQYKYSPQGKRLTVVDTTLTNDHGEYRIHGLMPGSYYVAFSTTRDRVLKENGVGSVGRYPVTFYPSVTSLDTAVATPVKAADEAIVNVTLTAAKGFSVRGKITGSDPDTKPLLMMSPVLSSGDMQLNIAVADNGTFEINGIVPGNYTLMAMGSVARATASGKRKITIEDRDVNDVLLTLAFARPPIGGYVFGIGRPDVTGLMVRLVPGTSENDEEDSTMALPPMANKGSPKPDRQGHFTAAALDRDAKRVFATIEPQAAGYEDWYVAGVHHNGQDVTTTGFDPASGGQLMVDYSKGGGMVQGTVISHSGQPIPGATAVLIPDDAHCERRDLFRFVRANQHGEFIMRGLAPGDYSLVAWENDIEMDAIYDADYMKPYLSLSNAHSVKVSAKTKYNVALNAISDEVDQAAK